MLTFMNSLALDCFPSAVSRVL